MKCPACDAKVLEIDVKCGKCGAPIGTSGAHRMLGTTVLGQYELVDVVGQGGMSVVYKGRHRLTDQEVALKILPPELAAHAQVKGRFLEEAKALAQLDHPHIVHLYNFGQENGCFVLAMQFVRGKTWERMIMENERLDWSVSTRIAIDVLRALEYAHGRGVVHRDMKPSNVLVRQDDGTATVMDFGIAKMAQSTRLTATGQTMGTVRYMSPEQVRGQEVDFKTDIYSFGATLYESLTGDTPFDGSTHFEIMTKHLSDPPKPPSVLGVELPRPLEEALLRSLSKKIDDRWGSARDFRKALEGVMHESDMGLAETMRLARDSIAPRSRRPSVAPLGSAPAAAVEMPTAQALARAASATPLADRLEPDTTASPVRSRAALWVVLAALVAGGGGVAIYVAVASRSSSETAAVDAASARPAPFAPTGIAWSERRESPAIAFFTAGPANLDAVIAAYDTALADLNRSIERTLTPGVINVLAVPRQVMCDPATTTELYKGVPRRAIGDDKCGALDVHYRVTDRSLVVVGDPDTLSRAMREGLADYCGVHHPEAATACATYRAKIERD